MFIASYLTHSMIDHGDGLLALRIANPVSQDSGSYTCNIASEYGCCTTTCEIIINNATCKLSQESMPTFIEEPLPVVTTHGTSLSFHVRTSPDSAITKWFICGREITESAIAKIVSRCYFFLNPFLYYIHHIQGDSTSVMRSPNISDAQNFIYKTNISCGVIFHPVLTFTSAIEKEMTHLSNVRRNSMIEAVDLERPNTWRIAVLCWASRYSHHRSDLLLYCIRINVLVRFRIVRVWCGNMLSRAVVMSSMLRWR